MFDRVSFRYDLNNALLSFGLDFYWRWRARRLLNLRPDDQVIDLCCGTGAVTRCLAEAVPLGRVVGVDFSEGMLEPARRHRSQSRLNHIEYLCSDVLKVPLPDHSFDALTICYGPRNIVDLPGLWKDCLLYTSPSPRD